MHHIIVSDLHLGDGGPREDFLVWGAERSGPEPDARPAAVHAMDTAFAAFLSVQRAEAGAQPHLILLGDFLDLWQVRRSRESWRDAAFRCFQAHVGVVCALRDWLGAGGRIAWVLGNHDQPMVDAAAWGLARELFPGLNAHAGGAPVFEYHDQRAGLRAEHGHQRDPFNRFRQPTQPGAESIGHRIVRHAINPLEHLVPTIDKGRTAADALAEAWRAGRRDPRLWKAAIEGLRAARPGRVVRALLDAIAEADNPLPMLAEFAARRAAEPTPVASEGVRFFATGHTHRTGLRRAPDGTTFLNAGTWRPTLAEGGEAIEQQGSAVVVAKEGARWGARLVMWPVA